MDNCNIFLFESHNWNLYWWVGVAGNIRMQETVTVYSNIISNVMASAAKRAKIITDYFDQVWREKCITQKI